MLNHWYFLVSLTPIYAFWTEFHVDGSDFGRPAEVFQTKRIHNPIADIFNELHSGTIDKTLRFFWTTAARQQFREPILNQRCKTLDCFHQGKGNHNFNAISGGRFLEVGLWEPVWRTLNLDTAGYSLDILPYWYRGSQFDFIWNKRWLLPPQNLHNSLQWKYHKLWKPKISFYSFNATYLLPFQVTLYRCLMIIVDVL